MAIEALVNFGKPFKQHPHHDLESFLYVILYICTYTIGPGVMRKHVDVPSAMTIPLSRWFMKEYIKEIGRTKIGHMATSDDSIISKFDEYWADFVPFVRELIKTCFPYGAQCVSNSLTHANMLEILARAHDAVRDDDPALDRAKRPRLETSPKVPEVPRVRKGRRSSSGKKG